MKKLPECVICGGTKNLLQKSDLDKRLVIFEISADSLSYWYFLFYETEILAEGDRLYLNECTPLNAILF